MATRVGMYHFHCADPLALGAFWSRVLEIPVDDGATGELAFIDASHQYGSVTWIFQRTHDVGPTSNRIVLDLGGGPDWREEAERIEGFGAARMGEHNVEGNRWIDLADVEGNLFRIFAPRPDGG